MLVAFICCLFGCVLAVGLHISLVLLWLGVAARLVGSFVLV